MTMTSTPHGDPDITQCSLPGCTRQMEKGVSRYCSVRHRTEHRALQRGVPRATASVAASSSPVVAEGLASADRAERHADLRHRHSPTPLDALAAAPPRRRPETRVGVTASATSRSGRQTNRAKRRCPPLPRRKAVVRTAMVGILVVSVAEVTHQIPAVAVYLSPVPANPPAWVVRAQATLTTLDTQLGEIESTERAWGAQPEPLRTPTPDAVRQLHASETLLREQTVLLRSELSDYQSLSRLAAQQQRSARQLADNNHSLSQLPPPGRRTPEEEAAALTLTQLRAEYLSEHAAEHQQWLLVNTAVQRDARLPLPDTTNTHIKANVAAVNDYIEHPGKPRTPSPPSNSDSRARPDATDPRRAPATPERGVVHNTAPPQPGPERRTAPRMPTPPRTGAQAGQPHRGTGPGHVRGAARHVLKHSSRPVHRALDGQSHSNHGHSGHQHNGPGHSGLGHTLGHTTDGHSHSNHQHYNHEHEHSSHGGGGHGYSDGHGGLL
jgi:hypothetical protein